MRTVLWLTVLLLPVYGCRATGNCSNPQPNVVLMVVGTDLNGNLFAETLKDRATTPTPPPVKILVDTPLQATVVASHPAGIRMIDLQINNDGSVIHEQKTFNAAQAHWAETLTKALDPVTEAGQGKYGLKATVTSFCAALNQNDTQLWRIDVEP